MFICDRSSHFIEGKYRHVENFPSHADEVSIKVQMLLILYFATFILYCIVHHFKTKNGTYL